MSRVGNAPVAIPSGVEVKVDGPVVTIKGSKGELKRTFSEKVAVAVEEDQVVVTRVDDERESRALHGLTRALVNNMVVGVSDGFEKRLELVGVGYRASLKGKSLELLVGFSHPVDIAAPEGIEIEVPENTKITVRGIDKELVGQIAADIRGVRPPEPYKGKGIRYEGEYVRRKAGKAAAAVGA
jgi:large subunit ribosomal protein L6